MDNSLKRSNTLSTGTYTSTSNLESTIGLEYNSEIQIDFTMRQNATKRKGNGKISPYTTPIVDFTDTKIFQKRK